MKKQVIIIMIGLWFNLTDAQQKNDQEIVAAFDTMLSESYHPDGTGASVIVARKGEIIYHKAFGLTNLELDAPMKPENVFRIGSITKQFTAVAILQLVEEGKLRLDDELTMFIPDYPVWGNKITIENLLTHTSGIRNFTSMKNDDPQRIKIDYTPAEIIDIFKNEPLRFLPGTQWEYSNSGYILLGYIIEKVTGQPYGEYLDRKIFKPLGMKHTLYSNEVKLVPDRSAGYTMGENGIENAPYVSMTHPFAAGAILSTVEDLFTWHNALVLGKVIKKETLQTAWSRYKLSDGQETNYGYGWRIGNIQGSRSIWHGGLIQGFLTMAMYLPDEEVFVAIFTNCDCTNPEDILARMAAIEIGKPYAYTLINVEGRILQNYTGLYENDKGQLRLISFVDNKLYSQIGRGPKFEAKPFQEDRFYFDDNPFLTMEFYSNAAGSSDSLMISNREGITVWRKSDKPIPNENGIKVSEKILEMYVGEYEITPEFLMTVTRDGEHLFLQATGQEKLEMFAENESTFFLKVNDATLEFIRDDSGQVAGVVLNQGGRQATAKKVN